MSASVTPIRYRVYITPLWGRNLFGTEIEVTDDCDLSNTSIKAGFDKLPFDIGTFLYDDLQINLMNQYGRYSNEDDSRSIFKYLRDGAKVRIIYHDKDDVEYTVFKGLVDELGTKDDVASDTVKLSVLSKDSMFRRLQVNAGSLNAGMLFSQCIASILDRTEITTVLSFDPANIVLSLDLPIDDGSFFDNMSTREALDNLLTASNSLLLISSSDVVTIRPRTASGSTLTLYGPDEQAGEQNIIDIKSVASGYGQMFNSISVNNTNYRDENFTDSYLGRIKEFDMPFITDPDTELSVATELADEFKRPLMEIFIEVPTALLLSNSVAFLNTVVLYYSLRKSPAPGEDHVPLYGQATYGSDKYPISSGSFKVSPSIGFKIIGIETNLATFTSIIRVKRIPT